MPPYSWVRSNVPRGNSSSRRSLASVRIRSASFETDLGRNGAAVQRRTSSYIGASKFAWNGIGCSGGSGTGPSLWSASTVAAGSVPSEATNVPSLTSNTFQMSAKRDSA